MSYRIEGNDIIIDGWERGIAPSPETGIADMRNINNASIPFEAAVGFSTSAISYPSSTGTITNVSSNNITVSVTTGALENGMTVKFAGSLPTGMSAGTLYYIGNLSGGVTFNLYTDQALSSLVTLSSTTTGGSFSTLNMDRPMFATQSTSNSVGVAALAFIVDKSGYVWGNNRTTATNSYWTWLGNNVTPNGDTTSNVSGNGIVYYQGSNGTGWLFVFRNSAIDYTQTGTISWNYGWNPATGSTGSSTGYLNTGSGTANSHHALVGQDNLVYYCDGAYVGSFGEKSGQTFSPTSTATYTFAKQALALPGIETATWLAEQGVNLVVAGSRNYLYPWDRTSTSYRYPLMLPEYAGGTFVTENIPKMVTLNTTLFVFTGNRGNIYLSNGSQAALWAKVPDHISNVVSPYFQWGAVGFNRRQIFFGVKVTDNAGNAITGYGGLWAIDTDTNNMRQENVLSHGAYTGYATVFIPRYGNVPGDGDYIGWDNGSSTYGVDQSSSTPYTGYQSYIDTDIIPIGTSLKPKTPQQIEWKMSARLVSGEGIKFQQRANLTDAFVDIAGSETTTVGAFSNYFNADFQNYQWLQLRILMKSTGSSPSYSRLREVRIRAVQ